MGATQVQKKGYASSGDATTHNIVFDSGPTQGNLLIVSFSGDGYYSSGLETWTQVVSRENWSGTYIYYKIAGAGESATIAITIAGSTSLVGVAYEYSGMDGTPFDKAANDGGADTSAESGTTATTAQAAELLIACVGTTAPGSSAPSVTAWSNSFGEEYNAIATGSGSNVRHASASRIVAATGAYSTTGTLSGSSVWEAGIATFKIAAAAATKSLVFRPRNMMPHLAM